MILGAVPQGKHEDDGKNPVAYEDTPEEICSTSEHLIAITGTALFYSLLAQF